MTGDGIPGMYLMYVLYCTSPGDAKKKRGRRGRKQPSGKQDYYNAVLRTSQSSPVANNYSLLENETKEHIVRTAHVRSTEYGRGGCDICQCLCMLKRDTNRDSTPQPA